MTHLLGALLYVALLVGIVYVALPWSHRSRS